MANNLLIAQSPVFERMLLSKMKEAESGVIELKEVSLDVVRAFVRHLRLLDVENMQHYAADLFKFAHKHEVNYLKVSF